MKKLGNMFPILLMIWPYLFLLFAVLPDESGQIHGLFLIIYSVFTVLVYGLNIWNAFAFGGRNRNWRFMI